MKHLAVLALALVVGIMACRDESTSPNAIAPDLTAAPSSERSGWFHTQWGDPRTSRGAARLRHELVDDGGQVTVLDLDGGLLAQLGGPLALDRRRITVVGAASGNGRFAVHSLRVDRGAQPAAGAAGEAGVPRIGSFPYVTVGCKFADVAGEPHSIATYQSWTAGSSYPGLNNYWIEASFNQMNVSNSTARGWFILPQPRSHYVSESTADLQALLTDCLAAADPTVNFPAFYGINMQFNAVLDCCSWGGSRTLTLDAQTKTYGITWMADWADVTVYAHEEGHSLGLPHSSGPYTATYDSYWDMMSYGYPNFDFGQGTYIPQHTISYHKDLLGWIAAGRKISVATGTTQTITLERLAQPGAGNFLMARIPIDNAAGQFYTVEARRRVGNYDTGVPADAVVLHRVDPTRTDRVAQVVDPDNNGDPNDAGAEWTVGETFTDAANAITVKVNAQTATGFQVTISHGATTSSNVWASRTGISTARSGFAFGAANGLLYAVGGKSGTSTIASVQAYNPTSNAWSSKAALPSARADGDGAAAINGILYVPGGRNASGVVTRTLYAYNASTGTWGTKAALPTASGCGGTAVISGLLYVLTGCDASTGFKGLLHRYSPSTNAWTARAAAPAAHGFAATGVIGGKLYVAGGRNGAGTATAALHVYTPGTNTWVTRSAMPAARFGAAGQVISGKLYVVGGTDALGHAVATTFVYDPATNLWSTKAPMPTARTGLGAGVAGGLLYAVGGRSGTTDLKTVQRYTP